MRPRLPPDLTPALEGRVVAFAERPSRLVPQGTGMALLTFGLLVTVLGLALLAHTLAPLADADAAGRFDAFGLTTPISREQPWGATLPGLVCVAFIALGSNLALRAARDLWPRRVWVAATEAGIHVFAPGRNEIVPWAALRPDYDRPAHDHLVLRIHAPRAGRRLHLVGLPRADRLAALVRAHGTAPPN
jgi:hypothetical protein